jgi:sugar lactone lactonase YvrE
VQPSRFCEKPFSLLKNSCNFGHILLTYKQIMNNKSYILFLAFIAAIVFLQSPVFSAEDSVAYEYHISWGEPGHEEGQLMFPEDMCFSPDGRMLALSDTKNNRICLFFVDRNATQPLKLKAMYGQLWPWANRTEPGSPSDKYRERDYLEGRREEHYLTGRAYQGGQGRVRPADMIPFDRFNLPVGVAWLGTDTILIADTGNHRIKALALNGEIKWVLGQEGWKDGYFHHPLGIDVDCDGNLYVTEPRSNYLRGVGLDFLQRQRVQGNRMQKFSPEFKPIARLGHMHRMSGRDYRQFKDLTRVIVDRSGDVYLTDSGNHRIMQFGSDLKKKNELISWPHYDLRYPQGIDKSASGLLAIADTGNHHIVLLDSDFKIHQLIGKFGTLPGHLSRPRAARFGPGGDLYVLNTGNCRIDIYRGPSFKQFPRCPQPEPVKETPMPPPEPEVPESSAPTGQDSH